VFLSFSSKYEHFDFPIPIKTYEDQRNTKLWVCMGVKLGKKK